MSGAREPLWAYVERAVLMVAFAALWACVVAGALWFLGVLT